MASSTPLKLTMHLRLRFKIILPEIIIIEEVVQLLCQFCLYHYQITLYASTHKSIFLSLVKRVLQRAYGKVKTAQILRKP
jgi:hypothetical protein